MDIKIRLYKKIDADLIALYQHPSFSLPRAILLSLEMSAGVRDKTYLSLPEPRTDAKKLDKIEFSIQSNHPKVADFLKKLPFRTRNDTLKNLVRGYLSGPYIPAFTNDETDASLTFFNGDEKPLSDCIKTRSDVEAAYSQEMQKIQKILSESGKAPEEILSLLENLKSEQKEEDIKALKKKTEEILPQKEAEVQNDNNFDLFGAVQNMMN